MSGVYLEVQWAKYLWATWPLHLDISRGSLNNLQYLIIHLWTRQCLAHRWNEWECFFAFRSHLGLPLRPSWSKIGCPHSLFDPCRRNPLARPWTTRKKCSRWWRCARRFWRSLAAYLTSCQHFRAAGLWLLGRRGVRLLGILKSYGLSIGFFWNSSKILV